MRLGCKIQARSDSATHRIDWQVCRVIHIDEITHIDLVIRSGNCKIVAKWFTEREEVLDINGSHKTSIAEQYSLNLFQQSVAHFRPYVSLFFNRDPILLRNYEVCHRFCQVVKLF